MGRGPVRYPGCGLWLWSRCPPLHAASELQLAEPCLPLTPPCPSSLLPWTLNPTPLLRAPGWRDKPKSQGQWEPGCGVTAAECQRLPSSPSSWPLPM